MGDATRQVRGRAVRLYRCTDVQMPGAGACGEGLEGVAVQVRGGGGRGKGGGRRETRLCRCRCRGGGGVGVCAGRGGGEGRAIGKEAAMLVGAWGYRRRD